MSNILPYDLNSLAGGAIRVLIAPISAPVSTGLQDVFSMVDPYTEVSPWDNAGATSGPFTYGRNLTVSGFNIEQETSAVLETPQEVARTIAVPLAEIRPDILKIMEESPAVGAVAAGANTGAQSKVPVGSVEELTQYRVAFVSRRLKAQGLVTEPSTKERGRFLGFVAYRAQMNAENVQVSFGKGALASATVTFKLFPEPTITEEGEQFGAWFDEAAGTIAAT